MENHNDHSMHMGNLKQKFFISLILTIPIILFSPMMGINLPFQITFIGSEWVVLILATILFFYGGMPFLQGAKMELSNKAPAMMTLIALGISVAYFYSIYAFVMNNYFHDTHIMDFFWELATLIVIMLFGHWIEMNAVASAGDALKKMAELLPSDVTTVNSDGTTIVKPISEIKVGELALVKAGEKIPADGVIISGETTINESMITGESKEVSKGVKDEVIGGSINGVGTITIKISATTEDSYLAQVMKLVSLAQQEKSSIESISDKVARLLFYVALFSGVLSFIVWFFITKDLSMALERMVTVLVIACPHALGLAIPLVIARATSIAAKNGLLIKNRQSLEQAKAVDVIMLDKTGTLTKGNFSVSDYISFSDNYSNEEILEYMASLEQESSHPLALSILNKANDLQLQLFKFLNIKTIPGVGIVGEYKNKEYKITNEKYLLSNNIEYNTDKVKEILNNGVTISFLLINDEVVGLISQGDEIKENAKVMIDKLKELKVKPVMLTGDNEKVAKKVGQHLGITDIHAQLLPEDKEKIIKEYKEDNKKVIMVGDGINDAPSLVAADIGIAIGAGTDIAIDSADVILVKDDPADIINFLHLAVNTNRKMVQNLWWGAGYNIIAIPLAAGILAGIGIILSPAIGAILMSLSTIIVAINAMTLKIN